MKKKLMIVIVVFAIAPVMLLSPSSLGAGTDTQGATGAAVGLEQPLVTIWLEQGEGGTYVIGDALTVCYSVARPIEIRLSSCPEGETCRVVVEGFDDGQGDCMVGTISPPAGRRVVRIEAIEDGLVVAQAETFLFVQESAVETPTDQPAWVRAPSWNCLRPLRCARTSINTLVAPILLQLINTNSLRAATYALAYCQPPVW